MRLPAMLLIAFIFCFRSRVGNGPRQPVTSSTELFYVMQLVRMDRWTERGFRMDWEQRGVGAEQAGSGGIAGSRVHGVAGMDEGGGHATVCTGSDSNSWTYLIFLNSSYDYMLLCVRLSLSACTYIWHKEHTTAFPKK